MEAFLIKPSEMITLSPVCGKDEVCDLQILGKSIKDRICDFADKYGVHLKVNIGECIECLADDESTILIENNLICNADLREMLEFHRNNDCDITALFTQTVCGGGFGAEVGRGGRVTSLEESGIFDNSCELKSVGVYIVKNRGLKELYKKYGLCIKSIIVDTINGGGGVFAFKSQEKSAKIYSIDSLKNVFSGVMNGELNIETSAEMIKKGVWVEENVLLSSGVRIETPVYISKGCRIERDAKIGGEVYLGKNTVVKSGALVSHSIVGDNCCIAENTRVYGAVLCDNVKVSADCKIEEKAVIASNCRIEENCVIRCGVKIWQNKRVSRGTRLSDNLIWGSVGCEHIFRDGRLFGELNIDITPEFVAKLGTALGTMLNGEKIGLGFDSDPVCRMLAYGAVSGIMASGARIFMFGEASLPLMREGTRYYGLKTSIYINQSDSNGIYYPEICFVEADGGNMTKERSRELENIFFNNIFCRAETSAIHEQTFVRGFRLFYIQNILNKIVSDSFKFNMEIRTKSETLSDLLEVLLPEIERITEKDNVKQFSADIDRSGRLCALYTDDGNTVDKSKLLAIQMMVLTEHLGIKTAALPVYASKKLETSLTDSGVSIVKCKSSDEEFLRFLCKEGMYEEAALCFDGIYFCTALLDFLNHTKTEFKCLCGTLPSYEYRETEVECPDSKKTEIIRSLCIKYSEEVRDMTEGVKIYQDRGWVLVLPEDNRHFVKIITEGYDTEAAEELSINFTNQVKRLAKLN